MRKIAEIVLRVVFEDGEQAVFTVSPGGQLSPSQADGVASSASCWYEASEALHQLTEGILRMPEPNVSAPHGDRAGRVGICWPWSE